MQKDFHLLSDYRYLPNPESVSNSRFELEFGDAALGVNELTEDTISVYPNPASEIIYIQIPKTGFENAKIQLMDMNGKLLSSDSAKIENGLISTRQIKTLESGVYILKVEVGDKGFIKKVIVN